LSTNASYVDIGSFATGMAKNGLMSKSTSVLPLLCDQQFLPVKFLFESGWIADYPDAENYLPCFTVKLLLNGPNYTHFNEEFDNLYEQAFKE
jgi:peptide/nickel transport system substrate-binding protein